MGQQTAKYAIQDFKFLKADADQETVVFLTKWRKIAHCVLQVFSWKEEFVCSKTADNRGITWLALYVISASLLLQMVACGLARFESLIKTHCPEFAEDAHKECF